MKTPSTTTATPATTTPTTGATRAATSPATSVIHAGRDPARQHGLVNTPVYRGSTVVFPTLDALEQAVRAPFDGVVYGRYGTPTHHDLQQALSRLEGAAGTVLTGSGLSAITTALLACARAGDHVLFADCVYDPTRAFAERALRPLGIEVGYFDPRQESLGEALRANTRVLFLESPGSLSFEVQDIPALATEAHARGAVVICDNTWATPLFCNPLALGADIVVHAATKYLVGHADAMLGAIACNAAQHAPVRAMAAALGQYASPDDCFLALRGLRTLDVRLRRHQDNARALAQWLAARPEVEAVLHPALPGCPGHARWRRDYRGSSGLFSFVLRAPVARAALARFCDGLRLFAMGFSWGGYESLLLPVRPERTHTSCPWPYAGPTLRVHAGLEDPADLIADMEAAFARLAD